MTALFSFVFNIEHSLLIGIVTSFVLGALLLLIKIPDSDYTRKVSCAKNTIAVCYFLCTLFMFLTLRFSGIENYSRFVSLMLFVITAESSVILSFSMINVLEEGFIDLEKYYLNLLAVCLASMVLIWSFWWKNVTARMVVMSVCSILFVVQCVMHIYYFRKVYRRCLQSLSLYYDDDEDRRLKKIKFCYVIMMLTQMFILVYLPLPFPFMKIWILWYSLFLLYYAANFISFVGSHKFMLDAFAYNTLSFKNLKHKISEVQRMISKDKEPVVEETTSLSLPGRTLSEAVRLEKALERWVAEKKFREFDKTRDEIAAERVLRSTRTYTAWLWGCD